MRNIPFARSLLLSFFFIVSITSCREVLTQKPDPAEEQYLTIFFVNDMHGQLNNFAKIKHIVDAERALTNVLLVSAGDIFSGNPIVDQYEEKGYPIIDIMNKTGFDISVIGNHEFDYGLTILNKRMQQAEFAWVCANVNTQASALSQPDPYTTLTAGDLKVTFLGLVETSGKPGDIIPSTHPWRIADLTFQWFYDVVDQYKDLKSKEGADLLIALTHIGSARDSLLANEQPFFDLIIGGHSHERIQETVNNIPLVMAGAYLSHLGKIELTIVDKKVTIHATSLINLNSYPDIDPDLKADIDVYNNAPEFAEVVGYATSYHNKTALGCFYTTALKEYMAVDISLQNGGGIRADIDEGDISILEIYNMDPFNNGSVVFTMTAGEIKDFFKETSAGLHVSGISIKQIGEDIIFYSELGEEISNSVILTLGINDYIPAVYDSYFPFDEAEIRELTTAESIIEYLKTINSTVDYAGCNHYFRYK